MLNDDAEIAIAMLQMSEAKQQQPIHTQERLPIYLFEPAIKLDDTNKPFSTPIRKKIISRERKITFKSIKLKPKI